MSSKYPLVAIVGAGALFPGSLTEGRFWQNILEGNDLLSEVPETHWLLDDYYDPDPRTPDRTYANRGGFLPEVDFSPMDFGVPPNIIPATDTAQLLALNIAKRVLEDAAQGDFSHMNRDKISVVLGVASATELVGHMSGRLQRPVWERALKNIGLNQDQVQAFSDEISASYTEWQESTFPGLLGNVVAGRIANRLDLGGTNCVVDAACASSLAALEIGLNELYLGQSDMVITGGVDTLNDILMFMCFSRTTALSPSGDCRPFSDQADGTMLGEGIGMFALKRLEDAERDGDKIYAVIQGLGSSSDGRAKSIYAPVSSGQAKALRRAYEHAGYGPETVELVEAHGTGTKAGDAAEVGGLKIVFDDENNRKDRQWCALGSVKSQIGHTKASAGSAGLFKVAMALHHKVIPPTIKVDNPNSMLDLENSPFYISTAARPWIRSSDHPRRASVSSFGFGGTNFHVALQEYDGPGKKAEKLRIQPSELFTWSSASAAELRTQLLSSIDALSKHPEHDLFQFLAYSSLQSYDAKNPARLAIVAEDAADLTKKLKLICDHLQKAPERAYTTPNGVHYGFDQKAGQVAFLFPGQGSQYINMGNQLAIHFDQARKVWDMAADMELDPEVKLHNVVFPPTPFSDETKQKQLDTLTATEWAQPAIGTTSLAVLTLLDSLGIKPSCVGGHSFGEVTSMFAAGVVDQDSFLAIARKRGELMAAASELDGSMTAVVAEVDVVREHLESWGLDVVVANHNSPTQVVISGATDAIEAAESKLQEAGLKFKRLKVATAFHSPLVSESSGPFKSFLDGLEFGTPEMPIYSNANAAPYSSDAEEIRSTLANQIAQPVRFVEQLEDMYNSGVRTFIEVGPEAVLTNLVGRTLKHDDVLAVSTDRKGKHSVDSFYAALAQLVARGLDMDFSMLWEGYRLPVDPRTLKKAPFQITLNGANYGKPSPYREPGDSAKQVAIEMNTTKEVEKIVEVPVEVVVEKIVEVPVEVPVHVQGNATQAPVSVSAQPTYQTQSAPAAPAADWLYAMDRMQQETAQAQVEYQRMMAEAHATFLRTAEQSMQHILGQGASQPAVTYQQPAAPSSTFVEPQVTSPLSSMRNGANGAYTTTTQSFVAPEVLAQQTTSKPAVMEARAPVAPKVSRPAPKKPAPAPKAPVAQPAPQATQAPAADLTNTMLDVVAEKTGYPVEMLELSMELEADLGIDSIKRVEILSAMQEKVPGLPEVETSKMASLVTLQEIVDYMSSLMGSAAPAATTTAAPVVPVAAAPATSSKVDLVPIMLDVVAEKTGYPVEMLELSMELEADLGIDSIKRVEILSAMQEKVPGLPEVETSKMASLVTLQEIVDYMSSLMGDAAPVAAAAPQAAPAAPAVDLMPIMLDVVAEKTGYPAEMLELSMELEADLGIDSIKRVEILSAMQEKVPGLPEVETSKMASLVTLQEIVDYMTSLMGSAAPVAVTPVAAAPAAPSVDLMPVMLDVVAEKTGYPAEMLDLSMELEADLGIDSIKRVEILSAMQEKVPGLPEVETSKMASLVTLQEIVDYMTSLMGSAAPAATTTVAPAAPVAAAPAAPSVDLVPVMMNVVAEKTGYPAEMLDLSMELEADLGIDSIKRVEILSAMQERVPGLPEVETSKMASLVTLQEIVDYMSSLMGAAPATATATPQAAPAAPAAPSVDLVPVMMNVVAEKTGYPAEMLDLSMELEADLGIDSIKRVEILSAMQERVPGLPEVETSKMASLVTLQEIVDYMSSLMGAAAQPAPQTMQNEFHRGEVTQLVDPPTFESEVISDDVARYEVHLVDAPARQLAVSGLTSIRTVEIISDGTGVAQALSMELEARGIQGLVVDNADSLTGTAQMVIYLGGLTPAITFEDAVAINREAFKAATTMAEKFSTERGIFVTVQDTGGDFGMSGAKTRAWLGGLAALVKTAQKEWTLSTARAIDIERGERLPGDIARAIADELWQGGAEVEVALDAQGNRRTLAAIPTKVGLSGRSINKSSVIVVSGGARGVTAASIIELARQTRASFVLLGRTQLSEEPAVFAGKETDAELKRAALEEAKQKGEKISPKDLNYRVYRVKADREVRQTLADLNAAGSNAKYVSVDVRNAAALDEIFQDVRNEWGHITGIVHGAGVLADAFLTKKTVDNFDHVFGTKIMGLKALLEATSTDDLEVVCLFSSVAARTGNAGQADYAMANEVLNRVAAELTRAHAGCHVKSLGWGPWEGGMVTPELKALFEQRGVALIPVDAGARAFAAEMLEDSSESAVEVVLGGGVVHGGLNSQLPSEGSMTTTLNISHDSHAYLEDHTIQGKVVLPVVMGLEWFTRAAQSSQPNSTLRSVRGLKVLKGVALGNFNSSGDVFGIELQRQPEGFVSAKLNDRAGVKRYEAEVELGDEAPEVAPFTGLQQPLEESPWQSTDTIYADDTLFHGPVFQVVENIEGFSDEGARATLGGLTTKNLASDAWMTDALLLDGCLQIALLWGLRVSKGQSLPMRVSQINFYQNVTEGPFTCELVGQQHSAQRTVSNIRVTDAQQNPVCDLIGVEMYVVPGGTSSK